MLQTAGKLAEGHEFFGRQAWRQAHEALTAADRADLLQPSDLELFATSAYMLGRKKDYLGILERAYQRPS